MASTVFVDKSTIIQASWLNDVNRAVYKDSVNVKNQEYGAVGDGVTDDTAAFNAALATGKSVFVPEGIYKISTGISVNLGKQSLVSQGAVLDFSSMGGTSRAITVLNTNSNSPPDYAANLAAKNEISGFAFIGPGKAGNGAAYASTVTCLFNSVPNTNKERQSEGFSERVPAWAKQLVGETDGYLWQQPWRNFPTQPPIFGRNDGIPARVANMSFSKWAESATGAAGNAVVPQVVYEIYKAIQATID